MFKQQKLVLVLPVYVTFSTATMNVNNLLDIDAVQAVYVDKHGKHYRAASISVDFGYLALETSETARVMA
jgi:regulatory protein YycI of two-component signal transduction system YycFG